MLESGGPEVLSEVSRRAWAVEQAIAAGAPYSSKPNCSMESVSASADQLLAYLETPFREADQRLLDAARGYDGTQAAAPLIGMLADALERMIRGG